jgi:hypothetical protein
VIRKDFETGGFPISRRCPVFCLSDAGELFIAYNRFTLGITLRIRTIKKCVGIWPGKRNTDCFPLRVSCYNAIPVPPKEHQLIDDSPEIKVIYETGGISFKRISYVSEDLKGNQIKVESTDEKLKDYIIKSGLQYKVLTEL